MLVKSSAQLRFLSIPPRKMRLVADIVKGLPVEKALGILNFTPKIAAHHLAKTLKSAAANALSKEGTDHLSAEDLMIKTGSIMDLLYRSEKPANPPSESILAREGDENLTKLDNSPEISPILH